MKIFRFGLISFVFVEEFTVKNTNQPILHQFLIKKHQYKNQFARWRASRNSVKQKMVKHLKPIYYGEKES